MNNFEKKMLEKYPVLFKDLYKPGSPMLYGLNIGKGWYDLLDELCEKLSVIPDITLRQVKEKFGLLRVYCSWKEDREEAFKLLNEFEDRSGKICEECGTTEDVETKGSFWIKTLCSVCRTKIETEAQKKRPGIKI